VPGGEERLAELRCDSEDVYLEATSGDDFVGVQTYSRVRVDASGMLGPEQGVAVTQMGYEYWPQALGATVRRATEVTGLPVLVTENGIGTDDDGCRRDFVTEALQSLHGCVEDGINVLGYVHWSLLDNFEWVLGYGPTFGLVAVDREDFVRRPKPSASWLGSVARANAIELAG
jgi:beta-glucosidase